MLTGYGTKLGMLGPTALRVILRPKLRIHAAVDRPIKCVSYHRSLLCGLRHHRNKKSRLPPHVVNGMVGERQIHDRNSPDARSAVVDFGLAANINSDASGVECPLRMRYLAGGHSAVVHHVMFR